MQRITCNSKFDRILRSTQTIVQFGRDDSGSTAVIFAICFSVVFAAVAMVIDFGYATTVKVRQQNALDAATLAASDELGTTNEATRGPAVARAFYDANTKGNPTGQLGNVNLNSGAGTVESSAQTGVGAWFMKVFGFNQLNVTGKAVVARSTGTVEVALVLDNSGSMNSEMSTLRTAAKEMSGILFVGADGNDRVRVGLVPFAASVNVGPHNSGASWMDTSGSSPVHFENFSGTRNRMQLFSDMGVNWAGCVEVRPSPHDVRDSYPSGGSTLFVPMFAPDEPDDNNDGGSRYYNSYIRDDGGACTPQPRTCVRYSRRGNCREWRTEPLSPQVAQSRQCKYAGQSPSSGYGPNYNCTTAAILPLTSTKAQVNTAIDGMVAGGWTNILQGTTWGWRVLSPDAPFTEGRSNGDSNNQKFLVIMTDGENTYPKYSNHNGSMYGAFSYTSKGRLSSSSPTTSMDNKTKTACANAKADGITIFTIAFREAATSAAARGVLASCASGPERALLATDGAGLQRAFENIGREINDLRIAG